MKEERQETTGDCWWEDAGCNLAMFVVVSSLP
jgi:hypothetical protein